jgi:hypothetical protein
MAGAINGNEGEVCMTFTNRDLIACNNARSYGEYPEYYQAAQCSTDDKDSTSCYNLGRNAGYAYAEKEIIRCHEIRVPPASGHTARYDAGYKARWLQANNSVCFSIQTSKVRLFIPSGYGIVL